MDSPDAEDTAFYTELKRQILLLMDEDDETHARRSRKGSLEFQRRSVCGGSGGAGSLMSGNYFSWSEGGRSLEVPSWMERLWANNGAGTGVFIPCVVAAGKSSRRRHHRPRKNKDRERIHSSAGHKIHG